MLDDFIYALSKDPFDPKLNFDVAVEYEKANQIASAVSFYLRTAEYGPEYGDVYVYTSLLKLAKCFNEQNDRLTTVANCLMQAIGYDPDRPEGYFLLSQLHERQGNWREAYAFARIGQNVSGDDFGFSPLPADVGYVDYGLEFEEAVAGWWLGRRKESIDIFNELLMLANISDEYRKAIEANLAIIL
jgi:tetratricopeptide (TPR) repeat protein